MQQLNNERSHRTSLEAAAILADIPPLEETIRERIDTRKYKKGQLELGIHGQPRLTKKEVKEILNARTKEIWQERWESCGTGRLTHQFIPNIKDRELLDIEYNSKLTQILTGHGQFMCHYKRIGKNPDGICTKCDSGQEDTPLHRIYICKRFIRQRIILITSIRENWQQWITDRRRRNELEEGEDQTSTDNWGIVLRDMQPRNLLLILCRYDQISILEGFTSEKP